MDIVIRHSKGEFRIVRNSGVRPMGALRFIAPRTARAFLESDPQAASKLQQGRTPTSFGQTQYIQEMATALWRGEWHAFPLRPPANTEKRTGASSAGRGELRVAKAALAVAATQPTLPPRAQPASRRSTEAPREYDGRLEPYPVVPRAPHRGESKPEVSALRGTLSTGADMLPVAGPFKGILQAVTGIDLVTKEPVSRWGEVAGVAAGIIPGGKLIAKALGRKVSEKLGEKGLNQAQAKLEHAPSERFNKRYHGPDAMTQSKDGKLTEWEAKGTKDGNTRVAKDTESRKQGSARKNEAYAKKMLTKRKKIGKSSSRIGGPYTAAEIDLWREVKDNDGQKTHMSTHTNTETGQVRVFERDSKGKIVKQTNEFKLDDFAATKQKLIEEYSK